MIVKWRDSHFNRYFLLWYIPFKSGPPWPESASNFSLYRSRLSFHCCLRVIWKLYSYKVNNEIDKIFQKYDYNLYLPHSMVYLEQCNFITYHFDIIDCRKASHKNIDIDKSGSIWNINLEYLLKQSIKFDTM